MKKLTLNNIQLFCRICLNALRLDTETVYNIHLVPKLEELVVQCTPIQVSKSDAYPKNLCQKCYDMLQDFQAFRSTAEQSAEVLKDLVQGGSPCKETKQRVLRSGRTNAKQSKKDHVTAEDDEELLITNVPAKFEPIDIKNPIDSDTTTVDDDDHDNNNESVNDDPLLIEDENLKEKSVTDWLNTIPDRQLRPRTKPKKKTFKCPHCKKQSYKEVYRDAHIRAVHEGHSKPFLCEHCNKTFTRYVQLRQHIKTAHAESKRYACDYEDCEAIFKLKSALKTHISVAHSDGEKKPPLDLKEVFQMHNATLNHSVKLICQLCFKQYRTKRSLSDHMKRHAVDKEHICKECGVGRVTRHELTIHMRTHKPDAEKYSCTICPQQFNHKNAIQRHIRVVHEGVRPFPCSYCNKRFATRNTMIGHERLHTGERPFECKICGRGFPQAEGLNSHMKNHDKSLRTHVCSVCSQRFITRKNLIDHEKRHKGSKPHICLHCNRGFVRKEDLQMHLSSHTDCSKMEQKSKLRAN